MSRPNSAVSLEDLERGIIHLLARRAHGTTICPSEVARALGGADWRDLMDPVRQAAWRLAASGHVVVLKGGEPIARDAARGPIRIGPGRDNQGDRFASQGPSP